MLVVLAVLLPLGMLIRPLRRYHAPFAAWVKEYWVQIAVCFILMAGFLVRVAGIPEYPAGFNQDEASSGYEAYAMMQTGADRNGVANPVHLISWGSGQNALYSYFCMPFIALFGLNEFAVRLPMALFGCVGLLAAYQMFRAMGDKRLAVIGTLFFAIAPWHIMKSRWALESNLFPELVLIGAALLVIGLKKEKIRYFYIACVVFGLSAYSYGTSYFFLPIFLVPLFLFLGAKKYLKWRHVFIGLGVVGIISVPILLFVAVNTFDLEAITTPFFTIPKLNVSRHTQMASVFAGDFFATAWENAKDGIKILLIGEDGLLWNSMPFYGIGYVFSLPFTVIGVATCVGKTCRPKWASVLNCWAIAAALLLFIVEPNINRLNICMPPLLFYSAIGIWRVSSAARVFAKAVLGLYLAAFACFTVTYFTSYQKDIAPQFFDGLGEAVVAAKQEDAEKIYITDRVNSPYIYALFYGKEDPGQYIATVKKANPGGAFEAVSSFGEYVFGVPEDADGQEDAVYILTQAEAEYWSEEIFTKTVYGQYILAVPKE